MKTKERNNGLLYRSQYTAFRQNHRTIQAGKHLRGHQVQTLIQHCEVPAQLISLCVYERVLNRFMMIQLHPLQVWFNNLYCFITSHKSSIAIEGQCPEKVLVISEESESQKTLQHRVIPVSSYMCLLHYSNDSKGKHFSSQLLCIPQTTLTELPSISISLQASLEQEGSITTSTELSPYGLDSGCLHMDLPGRSQNRRSKHHLPSCCT